MSFDFQGYTEQLSKQDATELISCDHKGPIKPVKKGANNIFHVLLYSMITNGVSNIHLRLFAFIFGIMNALFLN